MRQTGEWLEGTIPSILKRPDLRRSIHLALFEQHVVIAVGIERRVQVDQVKKSCREISPL